MNIASITSDGLRSCDIKYHSTHFISFAMNKLTPVH